MNIDYLFVNTINKWMIGKNISSCFYEPTSINSVFCQIIIGDFSIYLEAFSNETVLTFFRDKDCELAYAGNTKDCLDKITNLITTKKENHEKTA
mgnify:CR=1 FL=1